MEQHSPGSLIELLGILEKMPDPQVLVSPWISSDRKAIGFGEYGFMKIITGRVIVKDFPIRVM